MENINHTENILAKFDELFFLCEAENLLNFEKELSKICPQTEGKCTLKSGCKVEGASFSMTFLVSANTQNQATNLRSKLQNIVCKANKEEIDQAIYCIETVLEKAKNKVSLNFLFAVSLEKDLWAFQFSAKTM